MDKKQQLVAAVREDVLYRYLHQLIMHPSESSLSYVLKDTFVNSEEFLSALVDAVLESIVQRTGATEKQTEKLIDPMIAAIIDSDAYRELQNGDIQRAPQLIPPLIRLLIEAAVGELYKSIVDGADADFDLGSYLGKVQPIFEPIGTIVPPMRMTPQPDDRTKKNVIPDPAIEPKV